MLWCLLFFVDTVAYKQSSLIVHNLALCIRGNPKIQAQANRLLIDYLLPAKRLYMFSSGTGLAPFLSVIRDPETYEKFEDVILVHSVRDVAELAYHDYLTQELPKHEFLGEMVSKQLRYYPTVTREQYKQMGRITTLIENEKLFKDLGVPALDRTQDRIMICGSPGLLRDLKTMLEQRGFNEGNTTKPGDYVVERAFVEQ
jgi:ferredoxin--NADP+ reductase